MAPKKRYRIEYTEDALSHLKAIDAHRRTAVLESVLVQLAHQPRMPTRNRKLLRANRVAPWELRIGDIRVYFDVAESPERVVTVRAIGIKRRERVIIGGDEVDLQ